MLIWIVVLGVIAIIAHEELSHLVASNHLFGDLGDCPLRGWTFSLLGSPLR